jgi:radical SAM protein with 4Fe4S-binding SPASM domain
MREPDFQPILAFHPPLTFHFGFGAAGGRLLNVDGLPDLIKIQVKQEPSEACESLYRGPAILSDGSVSACSCSPAPMDADDLVIGNILESSLIDLWRSERMMRIRASFRKNCRPRTCQGCGQYEGLDLFRTPSGRRIARENMARAAVTKEMPERQPASMVSEQTRYYRRSEI